MKPAGLDRTDDSDCACRIVLVHDLQKRDSRDLRQRLESVVKGACRAAIESAGVSLRVSVYRVNYTRLQKRFEDEVEKLRDCVDSLQVGCSIARSFPAPVMVAI